MKIQEDVDLIEYSTLRLPARAKYFATVSSFESVDKLASQAVFKNSQFHILGRGSNTLFKSTYFDGLVIKMEILGKRVVKETKDTITLRVSAGEDWPDLVTYVVEKGWGGIENLAHIPGTAGAAPVQNIAAYGQNFSDIVSQVTYFDVSKHKTNVLTKSECEFGYRDSIFKKALKGTAIIISIDIELHKDPTLETSYFSMGGLHDSLKSELEKNQKDSYCVSDVYNAVVAIRSRKLLDWNRYPTVGSFFINPIVSKEKLSTMRALDPGLQFYPIEDLQYKDLSEAQISKDAYVKVPVGRLLDFLGWKGRTIGNCSVHSQVASIFTHNGKATGSEFLAFTETIRSDVYTHFGINLESEVTII